MSLPPLATVSDVEDRMYRAMTGDEILRVDRMLVDASAIVRNYARQNFTTVRATERIRPLGYRVRLPHRPVVTVHSVSLIIEGTAMPAVGYVWDGTDEIWLAEAGQIINLAETAYEWLATNTPVAEVDYTSGYDEAPADVVGVTCSMIARNLSAPGGGGIISEAVGEYTYRLSEAAAQGPLTLSQSEREILAGYRNNGIAIELRW